MNANKLALAALKPFTALLQEHNSKGKDSQPIFGINNALITLGNLRRAVEAAAALEAAQVEPVACTKCNGLSYYDEGHENDDGTMSGGNYVECDKCHPALAKREHITTGEPCWCNPETVRKDPKTGVKVIVHKEPM